MHKVFKLLSFFSTIGFLIALSWTYAYLPLKVKVMQLGGVTYAYDKHHFFYGLVVVAVVVNLVFFMINSFLRSRMQTPQDTRILQPWVNDFALLKVGVDVFFIAAIVFTGLHNRLEADKLPGVSFILYIGVGVLILWFLYFIYALFSRLKTA